MTVNCQWKYKNYLSFKFSGPFPIAGQVKRGIALKVCIIGAGIAGMSCALTLEKYGIIPDIYEQYDRPGGRVPYTINLFNVFNRPLKDPLLDLAKSYGISLNPIETLNRFVTFTPGNMYIVRGQLGYAFETGPSPRSINTHLVSQSSAGIKYGTVIDYTDLSELSSAYDWVVVATGSTFFAKKLGLWAGDIFRGWIRLSVAEGDFDPQTWFAWFNKSYQNNGHAYLGPMDAQRATLALTISDIKETEIEAGWNKFLATEKLPYRFRERFIQEHISGFCIRRQLNNILLIGNAGGLLDSLLGFGAYNAVVSGVLAARSIYEGTQFEQKLGLLKEKIFQAYVTRKRINKLKNSGYDHLVGLIKKKPVKKFIFSTNLDLIKLQAKLSTDYYLKRKIPFLNK